MKRIITTLFSLLTLGFTYAQMSGNYTIGGTGASFTSVVQAVDTLNANGVSGAVVFSIRQGTYTGQVKINSPSGASSTNTILFKPDTANTAPVVVTASQSTTSVGTRGTWVFNGSKHISVDSITILGTASGSGHAIEFAGSVEKISIDGCHLRVDTNSFTTSSFNSVIMDNTGSTNDADDISIENCTIKGGSYGIYFYGTNTSNQQTGWKIHNNDITHFYYAGIWSYYNNVSIIDNHIQNRQASVYRYPYGVRMYYNDNSELRRNDINMAGNTITYAYGVYMYYCDATSTSRKLVSNNMVYCQKAFYAFYYYNCQYYDFVHNTIKSGTGYNSPYTLYYRSSTSNTYRNNITYNSTGGYATYQLGTTPTRTHNNYYSSSTATNYTPGTTEKTIDPLFVSTSDLHIQSIGLNAAGFNFTGVTTDIDGEARTSTRDIGADEITPDTLDLKLESLASVYCAGSQSVKLNVMNFGLDTIKTAKVHWSIAQNGAAPVVQTPYSFSGNVSSGSSDTWNIGTYTFAADTVYQIWAYVDTVNGQIDSKQLNDTTQTDTFETALSGTYFVGGTNPHFATPLAAVTALNTRGICGSVTFKVRSGTYNAQLEFASIPGVSATDTIRFTSDTGSTQPLITSTTATPTLKFDGAEYITFDKLSVSNAFFGGQAIGLTKYNHHLTFDSCYLRVDTTSTSYTCRVLSKDNQNASADHIEVRNSSLVGGYASVFFLGGSSAPDTGLTLINNKMSQWYYYGVYIQYHDKSEIIGNDIDNSDRAGFMNSRTYGVYLYYSTKHKFNYNRVISSGYLFPYGIYFRYCRGISSDRSEIINNMISLPGTGYSTTSTFYNTYLFGSDYTNFYYNNMLINSGGTRSYTAYLNGSGLTVRNNNMVNFGSGYAFYRNGSTVTNSHNNAHAPTGTRYGGTGAIGGNSINVDPEYLSPTNLHVQSISLNSTALSISGVTKDYDEDTRSTTPDIGADEFTPPANDLRPFAIISPQVGTCGQDSADLIILVKNNGTNSQTTQPITAMVLSPTPDTLTATGSKTIASGKVDTVYVGKINTTVGGNFRFKLISNLSNDQRRENDTLEIAGHRIYKSPTVPVVGNNIVACTDIDTTLVGTTNGRFVRWYDDPMAAKPIYEGDSLKININTTDTFWVMASDDSESRVGIANNTIGFGRNYTVMNHGIKFDVLKEATLDTVTIYPNDSGSVTVRLLSSGGTLLKDTTFSIGTASFVKLPVGIKLNPGKGYTLNASGTATSGMWYTYSGARYPYVDSDSAVVMTSAQNGSTFQYYFFYDWKLSVEGCESGFNMVPVNVRPSLAVNIGPDTGYCIGSSFTHTFGGPVSGATSYKWHNNTTSNTFTATTKGTYWMDVTAPNGCVTRDSVVVSEVPIPNVTFTGAHYCTNQGAISVSGVPAGGTVTGTGAVGGLYYPAIAGPGSHSVTYTYTDSIGCSNSAVGTIVVDTAPAVTVTPPATICQNKNSVGLSGGLPVGGYYFGPNIQGNKILARNTGIDTVNYVYYAVNGCHDTATATVQIISSPTVNWGTVADMCENTPPVGLGATPSGGTYTGNGVSGATFDPSSTGVGTHKVSYTLTGGNGCSTTEERSVTVLPIPNVTLNALAQACEHEPDYPLVSYGFPAGGTFSGAHVDPVKSTFSVTNAGAGTYPITYIVENHHGCKDSSIQNLVINETPSAAFGGDKQICGSQTLTLDAKNPGANYIWSTGEMTQKITVTGAGQYFVSITANNCVGIDSVKVTHSELCLGLDPNFMESAQVNMFPNPTSGKLNVELVGFEGIEVEMAVLTIGGQVIRTFDAEVVDNTTNRQLDLTDISDGVYVLRVRTEHGSKVFRFTKNE